MRPFPKHPPCVAIDFETSAWGGACACSVGMVRIEDLEIVDAYYSLIRPPSSLVRYTHIHGLTWDMLKNERSFAEVWQEMRKFMADSRFLIAHNARFDRKVLHSCCAASDISSPRIPFICTLAGARKALSLKSYGLAALSAYFDIELDHHNASSDAQACALIYLQLKKIGLSEADMQIPTASRKASKDS